MRDYSPNAAGNDGRPKGQLLNNLEPSAVPTATRLSDGSKTDCYRGRTRPCVALEPHRIDAPAQREPAPTDTHRTHSLLSLR